MNWYRLTKPGIIRGNVLTALAGFFLAAQGQIVVTRLLALSAGLGLVIASGCVANNILDRHLDARMERTRGRALVSGAISVRRAIWFSASLGIAGCGLLLTTNLLTLGLALTGWLAYVALYGYAKRRTVHGTLVGSISGALPPVIGYTAVSGHLDLTAGLLFLLLTAWQMPHFFAIAWYRRAEYQAAEIPVLPLRRGLAVTRHQIIGYIIFFILLLLLRRLAGAVYLIPTLLASLIWLGYSLKPSTDDRWARRVFGWSLIVISVWSISMAIDSFI